MGTDSGVWFPYVARYQGGEWRAPIFLDMVLADVQRLGPSGSLTILDIGCGKGFDDDPKLQALLITQAGKYIGIEPDTTITSNPRVTELHTCTFEEALIEPASVDLAFSVMVLEHLEEPAEFWAKLHLVLRPGGIFWGFTIDARHPFAMASTLLKKLKVKERYLDLLQGAMGVERYENYPVFYRSNTPAQVELLGAEFSARTFLNFHRAGQLDFYLPASIRWIGRLLDRVTEKRGQPGPIMAVRAVK